MAALTAALLLAGCADSDGDTTPLAPTPTETQAAATPTQGALAAFLNVQVTGELAPYLVGPDGMTLYMFTNDELGVSNCAGDCATNWPPLTVPDGQELSAVADAPGELGVIERADGLGRQVIYNGRPLYYWASDLVPGDTTGHEVGGVWFVVPATGEGAAQVPEYSDY